MNRVPVTVEGTELVVGLPAFLCGAHMKRLLGDFTWTAEITGGTCEACNAPAEIVYLAWDRSGLETVEARSRRLAFIR